VLRLVLLERLEGSKIDRRYWFRSSDEKGRRSSVATLRQLRSTFDAASVEVIPTKLTADERFPNKNR
jgi:hypothetical protein